MWGAVIALVKLYAAAKGIFIEHWSLGKLYSFVENNVEERYRGIFADLLNEAYVLHIHFYEGHMGPTAFERQWGRVIELVEKAKRVAYESLAESRHLNCRSPQQLQTGAELGEPEGCRGDSPAEGF